MDIKPQLTPSAENKLKELVSGGKRKETVLRVCVGKLPGKDIEYVLALDSKKSRDSIFEIKGISITVSSDLLKLLPSIIIDFVKKEEGEEWTVSRPKNDGEYEIISRQEKLEIWGGASVYCSAGGS